MKMRFRLFMLLLAALPVRSQTAGIPVQQAETGKWFRHWLIAGPVALGRPDPPDKRGVHAPGFTEDHLAAAGGEALANVKNGRTFNTGGRTYTWKPHTADSVVDLRALLSRDAPVFAYAYTELICEKEQAFFLAFGTNDGGSLWLNGMRIWDYPAERGMKPDGDIIPISLKKGVNRLLLKVEQRGNKWEFCMRLLPFSTRELARRTDLFRIVTQADGRTNLESDYNPYVLAQLLKHLNVTVTDRHGMRVVNEKRTPPFTGAVRLNPEGYQPYEVLLEGVLKNGEHLKKKLSFYAGIRHEYQLAANQGTTYRIVVDKQASESERWAANELGRWLKEITGADFPIHDAGTPYDGPKIIVGYSRLTQERSALPRPDESDETYCYFNAGPDVVIFGGSRRGTLYGVMSFLENELGCRWYTPAVQQIPTRQEIRFTHYYRKESPGVRVRNDFFFEAFDPTWAARNKMNGSMSAPLQPGGVESYWGVHTFYPLVPPEEFFEKHPEYYSLLQGKRTHDHAQLCLSNPEVLQIVTDRIRKRMRESPEYLIYDVSQNDWYNACECDQCQAIAKREGGESGIMIWFVNQVADAVKSEFPGKFIGTLAYQYTRHPPKIKPRDNVVVRLCSIECCFAHDFKTCPENKSFLSDIQGWARLAPHLYIWDYVVNYSHYVMPYPNFRVLQSNIKTFRDNHAIGIMEQGAYQSRGGEFAELRAYVIAKLLWNPEADTEAIIDDFMYGYYGRAGQYVRAYFDLLHNRITPATHIHFGLTPEDPIFSDTFVREGLALFEKGEKVAETDEMRHRVELASLPLLYLKCKRTPAVARYDGTYDKFCRISDREKVTHIAEAGEPVLKAFHQMMRHVP